MEKLGAQWLVDLEDKQQMYKPQETDRIASESRLSNYEKEAEDTVRKLIEHEIPDGIRSCVSRGSDRLGLYVPFQLYGCRAFQKLKEWAEEQGLILSVDLQDDSGRYKFTVYPERSVGIGQ